MARSRTVIISGAGIGGLSLALALTRQGFRAVVVEQSERLDEAGAGIQLSPNATRVLIALGLQECLKRSVVTPTMIRLLRARNGRAITSIPLGSSAEARYGAPYWVIHRADLQAALIGTLQETADFTLRLGFRVEDFAVHVNGVTVEGRGQSGTLDEHGIAFVAADGLWSTMRQRLGDPRRPRFSGRAAWRATVPADRVQPAFREPVTTLWLGRDAHLVHYPVKGGDMINIVAIVRDESRLRGWSAAGSSGEILARFAHWDVAARTLLGAPDAWHRWSLFDRPRGFRRGSGPITLLGDAAHPMLPFLAQGGAAAIEDAAVLAACLAGSSDHPDLAMRRYEKLRRRRAARLQHEARRNGRLYHLAGLAAAVRNAVLRVRGGKRVLARYDWIYGWHPD